MKSKLSEIFEKELYRPADHSWSEYMELGVKLSKKYNLIFWPEDVERFIKGVKDIEQKLIDAQKKIIELKEKVMFQTISDEPCPKCKGRLSWQLCETGAEAFCKCGWTSLDA